EEAEGCHSAEGAGSCFARGRPERLSCVLDQWKSSRETGELGRTAEEMHREDGPRSLAHSRCGVGRIEVQRRAVDVGEHGRGPALENRLGRREEGERRTHDLVTWPDPERVEDEDERVGSVRDADALAD